MRSNYIQAAHGSAHDEGFECTYFRVINHFVRAMSVTLK
jgi:hypothetical protein